MGVTRLVDNIKNGTNAVIPIAIDVVVLLGAAFFGGAAINRLDKVEVAVTELAAVNTRVAVLEAEARYTRGQLDSIESKIDKVVDKVK